MSRKMILITARAFFWAISLILLGYAYVSAWGGILFIWLGKGKIEGFWMGVWLLLPIITWLILFIGIIVPKLAGRTIITMGILADIFALVTLITFFHNKNNALSITIPSLAIIYMGLWWFFVSPRL